MKENIKKKIMVLILNKRVGIFTKLYCFMILTNEELIIAYLDKEKESELFNKCQNNNENVEYAIDETDFRKCLFEFCQKYYEMSTEDILKEDRKNFSLRHIDINHIYFKSCKSSYTLISKQVGLFNIQTANKKIKFSHNYRDWNRNIYDNLLKFYDSRIKYTEGDMALSSFFKDRKEEFY